MFYAAYFEATNILLYLASVNGQEQQTYSSIPVNRMPITQFFFWSEHSGTYKFSYQTNDGIHVEEERSRAPQSAKGSYGYISPEGQVVKVIWHTDLGGFRTSVRFGLPDRSNLKEAVLAQTGAGTGQADRIADDPGDTPNGIDLISRLGNQTQSLPPHGEIADSYNYDDNPLGNKFGSLRPRG